MEKKKFENPELIIVIFDYNDIILTSGPGEEYGEDPFDEYFD